MAIYHLEAKVISRGAGRSAVAAAAYMSCSDSQRLRRHTARLYPQTRACLAASLSAGVRSSQMARQGDSLERRRGK